MLHNYHNVALQSGLGDSEQMNEGMNGFCSTVIITEHKEVSLVLQYMYYYVVMMAIFGQVICLLFIQEASLLWRQCHVILHQRVF